MFPARAPSGGLRAILSRVRPRAGDGGTHPIILAAKGARKMQRDSLMRRNDIREDQEPGEAARGFCRRCGSTHRLERSQRAESEAKGLMERIRAAGRLDFDAAVPDPRFAVERMYEQGGGKMLGVLLAASPSGVACGEGDGDDVVVIKAFSGQLYGEWTVQGWAPPLCGLTHDHPHYEKEHARIKARVDAAGEMKLAVEELEREMKVRTKRWDDDIKAAASRLREERKRRRATRAALRDAGDAAAEVVEEELAEESRRGKRELARLREGRSADVGDIEAALVTARREMKELRDEHRSMSQVLLGQIFDSYRLPNFREDGGFGHRHSEGRVAEAADDFSGGMSGATLQEAFVSDEHQEISNAEVNLPCGCGDCCAPKLLAEASRRGLVPLSIAEVWMGVPTAKEGYRKEGNFYGACRGRCRPILGHMLCGADKLRPRLIDPSADAIENVMLG